MNLLQNACAHEFAGRPPPTPEDEARLSAAIDKIFNKDSKMEQVTQTPEAVDMNDVVEKSAEAAQELLKQDGWSILRELHTATLNTINQTGLVVLPIMANLDDYTTKLKDPIGFQSRFETLSNDVAHLMVTAKALGEKFLTKTGKPADEDLQLISSLTMDYTKLQGYIEQTVHPLILILVNELEEVGINSLEVTTEGK